MNQTRPSMSSKHLPCQALIASDYGSHARAGNLSGWWGDGDRHPHFCDCDACLNGPPPATCRARGRL